MCFRETLLPPELTRSKANVNQCRIELLKRTLKQRIWITWIRNILNEDKALSQLIRNVEMLDPRYREHIESESEIGVFRGVPESPHRND